MSKSNKRVLIFCQAPADILYTLHLYEQNKGPGVDIHIIVVNIHSNYQFLKGLSLDCQLTFIPCLSLKNPIVLMRSRWNLMRYRKQFSLGPGDTVYFFSVLHDYVTVYFVEKLRLQTQVTLVDHYGYRPTEAKVSFFAALTLWLVRKILDVDLRFTNLQGQRFYYSPVKYDVQTPPALNIQDYQRYFYRPELDPTKPSILFFESNVVAGPHFKNYSPEISFVLQKLSEHFTVYIKGHPRIGVSEIVAQNRALKFIPNTIPGEFLDISSFKMVFGIDSAVIAHLALNYKNVYSLLPLFSMDDENARQLRAYLEMKSEQHLTFVQDIESVLSTKNL